MDFHTKITATDRTKNTEIAFHHLAHGLRANINYKDVPAMNISNNTATIPYLAKSRNIFMFLMFAAFHQPINIYNININSKENSPITINSANANHANLSSSEIQTPVQASRKTEMEHKPHFDITKRLENKPAKPTGKTNRRCKADDL